LENGRKFNFGATITNILKKDGILYVNHKHIFMSPELDTKSSQNMHYLHFPFFTTREIFCTNMCKKSVKVKDRSIIACCCTTF